MGRCSGPATGLLLVLSALYRVLGGKKKPLFEYDDHYVMLNDFGRNDFYRRALERVIPTCGAGCSVLDVGAGSGLLSMMAAGFGAENVLAIEANPDLAELANRTIERNKATNFPASNVTVVAELSSKVNATALAHGRLADVLVTETFGTMLLGEGAINFVPDARDRLLKPGGIVIPAGGCQYATLIEVPQIGAMVSPAPWSGFNLSQFERLQDTVYWKASMGASRVPLTHISERICILEVDLYRDAKESIPMNRTFKIQAKRSGVVHAVLFDWDVWADESRSEIMSSSPGSRNFPGDVAWGWLMQMQEEAGADWKYHGGRPRPLAVAEGEWLDLGVEFIARGISIHARVRRKQPLADGEDAASAPAVLPEHTGSPDRMRGVNRGDIVEASEYYLPAAGDAERHRFYEVALQSAVERNSTANPRPTLLDCSSSAGIPSLLAARQHGMHAVTLTHRNEYARVLREVAAANSLEDLVEAYAADARDFFDSLLPSGERVDIAVVDPPGTPLHGLSPFAVLPSIRKNLLKETGTVVPASACFVAGLVESEDLAQMFSVPGGRWRDIDLTVWNEETRRQRVLERLVPYTKWFGPHSTMRYRWLSEPRCVFHVDLNEYGRQAQTPEQVSMHTLTATSNGSAHAVVARWTAWAAPGNSSLSLGADSSYFGRSLLWPHYVQAVAEPDTDPGILKPVQVQSSEQWQLEVTVRQGTGKVTGAAGPEFSLRLHGAHAVGANRPEL